LFVCRQGIQFGYALHINDQSFTRFRQEFWRYAALWYVPRSGIVAPGDEAQWPSPVAASSDGASVAPSPSLAAVSSAAASSVPSSPSSTVSPSESSHFHTVVVLSSPQLTVILNGRVAELESTFSGVDEGGSGSGSSGSDGSLEPEDSTKHKFMAPREDTDDEDDTFSDVRPVHVRAESASMAAAAARLALLTHPRSKACGIECELTAWLEREPALPPGAIVSAVPRDKKRPMRFALRVDGQLLPQAPSPLVSVHKSLRKGSHSTNVDVTSNSSEPNSASAADSSSSAATGKPPSPVRQFWQASPSSLGSGTLPRALNGPSTTPDVESSSGSRGSVTPTSVAAAAASHSSQQHAASSPPAEDISDFGLLPIHAAAPTTK